jgi:hypothetical protein
MQPSNQVEMLSFLNFKFFLKFIHYTTKISGYLFISINFDSKLKLEKNYWNFVFTAISLIYSVFAIFFMTVFPVTDIIKSEILQIGCLVSIRLMIVGAVVTKTLNHLQRRAFFLYSSAIFH